MIKVIKVICLRCRRPQTNRVAQVSSATEFFLGCITCGYPYAIYAKEKE